MRFILRFALLCIVFGAHLHCGDNGSYAPGPQVPDMAMMMCPSGQMMCATGCVDTQTHPSHCGGCGRNCGPSQTCQRGICTDIMCTGNTMRCGNQCVDTLTDQDHCGLCNNPCLGGRTCALGMCSSPPYGTGVDGPLTFPSGTDTLTINTVSSAIGQEAAGSRSLRLVSPSGFAGGNVVLVIQSQGTGAGRNELATLSAIAQDGTATLYEPLRNSYAAPGAQAVVVPQYTDATIPSGKILTAPAWDGVKGGVLAFQANGQVRIEGSIIMSGKGFRGFSHAATCFPPRPTGSSLTRVCSDPAYVHGFYGESPAGPSAPTALITMGPNKGRGQANEGGGGGGTRGGDCAAGGGGGHGTSGVSGSDGHIGLCVVDSMVHGGGLGGSATGGADLTASLLMGSAGGEGGPDEDGAYPGAGGNGGGIIALWGKSLSIQTQGTPGRVVSNGADGQTGQNTAICGGAMVGIGIGMGGGGGGAGGAIRIIADQASLGSNLVTATGGEGGFCGTSAPILRGGTGGLGRVQVKAGQVTGTTQPAFSN